MVGELIMLPLRVGMRATRLWLRVAEETANVAGSAAGRLIGVATSRGSDGSTSAAIATPPRRQPRDDDSREKESGEEGSRDQVDTRQEDSPARAAESAAKAAAPARSAETPREPEPTHVSEEPTLVEEFAEPGAEDGAGAEIRIDEPWDGYAKMNAKQVVARLSGATPAELAAVQLYEGSNRRRQTILNVVQRELRNANGRSSRNQ